MKFESKFNVADLLIHKYNKSANGVHALEVMEIVSQTCYAGTQIFYKCRPIILVKDYKNKFMPKEEEMTWEVGHATNKDFDKMAWQQYREDELIPLNEEIKKIILQ